MKYVALIPSRSGSKGIPLKNTAKLAGKPLLQYTIEAAKESRVFDGGIYVASDSEIFLEYASGEFGVNTWGTHVPQSLFSDTASVAGLLRQFVLWYGFGLDVAIFVLYNTYPLRTAEAIKKIESTFDNNHMSSEKQSRCCFPPLIGVKTPRTHPYLTLLDNGDGTFSSPVDRNKYYRRQEYPKYMELCHFACVVPVALALAVNNQMMMPEGNQIYMNLDEFGKATLDIDSPEDLEYGEYLIANKKV